MSGCFLKTVRRRESLVFCRQAKVSKPDASDWSRRSVRSVFSGDNPALMISIALFGLIVRTILIGEGEKELEGASLIFLCCNLDPAVICLNEPFTE